MNISHILHDKIVTNHSVFLDDSAGNKVIRTKN